MGGCMNAWGADEPSSAQTVAGGHGEAARVPMNAWGAAKPSSARTIAGGHGNPPRVPI